MQEESEKVQHVVIVGGGTAGWLTAGRIAAEHLGSQVKVTLIESPDIPQVGVGEGTWPTMRSTLLKLGIRETDFIRECDASFKQGAKFCRWQNNDDSDYYYHPLMLPQGFSEQCLVPHWHAQNAGQAAGDSYSSAVCIQEAVCEYGLAPKTIRTPEYSAVANYAYHLNAGKFSQFLAKHCTDKLSVQHIFATVTRVVLAPSGDIDYVETDTHGKIHGDLFVDCTGFSSLLLGQALAVPFVSCADTLFVDSALAVQVAYPEQSSPIASHTVSTAQAAGWIWDIGLLHRRGIGHVYSSSHIAENEALAALSAYVGPAFNEADVKKIPIQSGHRALFWKNNCVAVGLSAGFLEPLEASAIVLVELSATMIAEQLPQTKTVMGIIAKRFNETFSYRWARIIDFLKLHYMLSKRSDNSFWQDNRAVESIPDSLQELLELWRFRPPSDIDFSSNNEVFPAASYQYVLYGMGYTTDFSVNSQWQAHRQSAQKHFLRKQHDLEKALTILPAHRELLNKIHQFGLQTV